MLGGSEKKIMCHSSARFILITWILTDTRRSKNIQKKRKFGWKIRVQHRLDKQDSQKKKCVLMWKSYWNFFTTPASTFMACSKVFRSSHNPRFICWKHMQIPSKPVTQACNVFEILMCTSKGDKINFKFLFVLFTCWLVR